MPVRVGAKPPQDAVAHVARALAARGPEIQSGALVVRERRAVALAQLVEAKAFPVAPVHLDQRGLALRRARPTGFPQSRQRAATGSSTTAPTSESGTPRSSPFATLPLSARPAALNGTSRRPCIRPSRSTPCCRDAGWRRSWRGRGTLSARPAADLCSARTRRSTASMRAAAAARSCCAAHIGQGFSCHSLPQSSFSHEAVDRPRKRGGIAQRHQKTRAFGGNHARHAAAVASDHGAARRPGPR